MQMFLLGFPSCFPPSSPSKRSILRRVRVATITRPGCCLLQAFNRHSVGCQPLLARLVVRHRALDAAPEFGRVMRGVQMYQFVDDDVLGHRVRQQHGFPVEIELIVLSVQFQVIEALDDLGAQHIVG